MSTHIPSYRKGIAAVIFRKKGDDLEYLVLYGKEWKLLKGTERNMSERSVLDKEMKDEVNLKAKKVQIITYRIKYEFPRWREKGYFRKGQDLQVYAVEVDPEAQVQLDYEENFDFHWAKLEEAKGLLKFEDHKEALEKADKYIRKQLELERKLQKSD